MPEVLHRMEANHQILVQLIEDNFCVEPQNTPREEVMSTLLSLNIWTLFLILFYFIFVLIDIKFVLFFN
jgi:hypothetical protein